MIVPQTLESVSPPLPTAAVRELIGLAVLARVAQVEHFARVSLASWHSSRQILQARRWHRVGFEYPLELTPLDARTEEPCGETVDVLGRDASLGGLSFIHPQPLPCRKVAISFPTAAGDTPPVIVRLTWCRFTAQGVYQSGGAFVRVLDGGPLVSEPPQRECVSVCLALS